MFLMISGHALGLAHSKSHGSLMISFYYGNKPDFKLSKDDIWQIQSLYGMFIL